MRRLRCLFFLAYFAQVSYSRRTSSLNIQSSFGRSTTSSIKFNDCSKYLRIENIQINNNIISYRVRNFPSDVNLSDSGNSFVIKTFDTKTRKWIRSGATIHLNRGYESSDSVSDFKNILLSDIGGNGFRVEGDNFQEAVNQRKTIKTEFLEVKIGGNVCKRSFGNCRLYVNLVVNSKKLPEGAKVCFEIMN